MAGPVNVRVDEASLNKAKSDLDGIQNGFVRAYARALNTAATGTQTDMVAMARDEYSYKVAAVKARTEVQKAAWTRLKSWVKSKGGAVPLTEMVGTRQTSTGLTVNVKKTTGLQRIPHAFIAAARNSGKLLAFWRAQPGERVSPTSPAAAQLAMAIQAGQISKTTGLVWRRPIIALYAPHPEVVYNTPANWNKLKGSADTRMMAAFAHEVDYVLNSYKGP